MKRIGLFLISLLLCFSLIGCKSDKDSVKIKYYADASELTAAMISGKIGIGLLPEPAMTRSLSAVEGNKLLFDLQELYGENSYPQAVMVAKTSLIEGYPKIIADLIAALEEGESGQWLKNNISDGIDAINGHLQEGAVPSLNKNLITAAVVDNCNIKTVYALDAKETVNGYMSGIAAIDSGAGAAASDGFFADIAAIKGGTNKDDAIQSLKVFMPDGAPALAMAKVIYQNMQFGHTITYTVVSPANIGPTVARKNADIAILPINAAVKLVGSGADYKLLTVNTHGNLFITGTEEITDLLQLKGKTVGVIGQGLVPDLTFKIVLEKNGLKYKAVN